MNLVENDEPPLGVTRKNPMGLHNRNTELQRALIFYAWSTCRTSRGLGACWRSSRGSADKVRRVDLNLIAPLRTHLPQRHLRVLQHHLVLHVPEAHANARGVGDGVRADADEAGGVGPGCGPEDQLEAVFGAELEAGDFCGGVGESSGDGCEALVIPVDVQGTQFGLG